MFKGTVTDCFMGPPQKSGFSAYLKKLDLTTLGPLTYRPAVNRRGPVTGPKLATSPVFPSLLVVTLGLLRYVPLVWPLSRFECTIPGSHILKKVHALGTNKHLLANPD